MIPSRLKRKDIRELERIKVCAKLSHEKIYILTDKLQDMSEKT